jgi:uncharacterized membrane protein
MTNFLCRLAAGIFIACIVMALYRWNPIFAIGYIGLMMGAMNERLTNKITDLEKK